MDMFMIKKENIFQLMQVEYE